MNRHLILTAAVFTLNTATLLLSLHSLAAAPSASCFGCTFAHDAAWLAAFAAASWYAAFPLLRLPRGNTAQAALAAAWLAAVQLYWLCALFADREPSAAAHSLGSVDIQLAKRIFRHKTADARRECEPMPSIAGICNAADAVLGRKSRRNR